LIDDGVHLLKAEQARTDLGTQHAKERLDVSVVDADGDTGLVLQYILDEVIAGQFNIGSFDTLFGGENVEKTLDTLVVNITIDLKLYDLRLDM
jgi:hypothetical protein